MGMPKLLKSVEKVDDYTVQITLNEPKAPFLADLAMDFAGDPVEEYADAMLKAGTPEKIDQEPIGTGPFSSCNIKRTRSSLRALPDYWGGKAKVDDLVFAITPDASVRWAKLQKGECHVMPYPEPGRPRGDRGPECAVLEQPGLNVGYLAYNTTKKPFDDVRVRKAMNMAIDKKAIIDGGLSGRRRRGEEPDPADHVVLQQRDQGLPVRSGARRSCWPRPASRTASRPTSGRCRCSVPTTRTRKRIAELMQADLAKVGIKAEIVSFEWGEYRKRAQAGEHRWRMLGWTGDNGDPTTSCSRCSAAPPPDGGSNVAKWCNKAFEDLVRRRAVTNQAERTKLYEQAQVDLPRAGAVVHHRPFGATQPVRKEVRLQVGPFGRMRFRPGRPAELTR